MKFKLILVTFVIYFSANLNSVNGQVCPAYPCIIGSSETGEVASAAIDSLLFRAAEAGERIFVIARRGGNEKTRLRLNLYRLCEARMFILDRSKGISHSGDSLSAVFAEDGVINGEGRLDFYIGSKLQLTRMIKRDRMATLNCCGERTAHQVKQDREECEHWRGKN